MPAHAKDPSVRARRNKTTTRAVLKPQTNPKVPPLPKGNAVVSAGSGLVEAGVVVADGRSGRIRMSTRCIWRRSCSSSSGIRRRRRMCVGRWLVRFGSCCRSAV
jgi:hypothetical protein